jgi:hypothetical protein
MLKHVLPECAEAELLQNLLEVSPALGTVLELLEQALDLTHADKIVLHISDLAIACTVRTLHRDIVEGYVLTVGGLEGHGLPIDLLEEPAIAVL